MRSLRGPLETLRARATAALRDPIQRWRGLAAGVAFAIFAVALWETFGSYFDDVSKFGFRDWDSATAYRYITVESLKRYHELPWWHPWFCGGFPSWAYVEGATNVVSPYLPLYLLYPVQVAVRLEVFGSTIVAFAATYLLAGRFTRSVALRAVAAVAFALNGRWVMQIAEGHTWHLQYAWLPLVFYFFDRSLEPARLRSAFHAGAVIALMIYMGGIYPAPHAALAVGVYAALMAAMQRRLRPLASLAIAGATGFALSAPKLLPAAELMKRFPRLIDSPEALDLRQLIEIFVDKTGSIEHDGSVPVPLMGWYEYGVYIGVALFLAVSVGLLAPAEKGRPTAIRVIAVLFLLLGMGSFHPFAPWTLLHKLPSFSSQHVPSRFLLPALLFLLLVAAIAAGRWLDRVVARRPWVDLLLLAPVWLVAMDIATVGHESSRRAFIFKRPVITRSEEFHHVADLAFRYDPDWGQRGRQELLAMFANVGVLRCYGIPPEVVPQAAPQGGYAYKGEAYVEGSAGATARVVRFTTNSAVIHYENAEPGAAVVYNMNWDPGWRADGGPAIDQHGLVAARATQRSGDVELRYRPPGLNAGLALCALALFLAYGLGPARARLRAWWAARQSIRSNSSHEPNLPIPR